MLKELISCGKLDLDSDKKWRFALLLNRRETGFEVGLNFVRSVGINKIRMGRKYKAQYDLSEKRVLTERKDNFIYPNVELTRHNMHLILIPAFSLATEDIVSFKPKKIKSFVDEIWQPNLINTRPDIYLEIVEMDIEFI